MPIVTITLASLRHRVMASARRSPPPQAQPHPTGPHPTTGRPMLHAPPCTPHHDPTSPSRPPRPHAATPPCHSHTHPHTPHRPHAGPTPHHTPHHTTRHTLPHTTHCHRHHARHATATPPQPPHWTRVTAHQRLTTVTTPYCTTLSPHCNHGGHDPRTPCIKHHATANRSRVP